MPIAVTVPTVSRTGFEYEVQRRIRHHAHVREAAGADRIGDARPSSVDDEPRAVARQGAADVPRDGDRVLLLAQAVEGGDEVVVRAGERAGLAAVEVVDAGV